MITQSQLSLMKSKQEEKKERQSMESCLRVLVKCGFILDSSESAHELPLFTFKCVNVISN